MEIEKHIYLNGKELEKKYFKVPEHRAKIWFKETYYTGTTTHDNTENTKSITNETSTTSTNSTITLLENDESVEDTTDEKFKIIDDNTKNYDKIVKKIRKNNTTLNTSYQISSKLVVIICIAAVCAVLILLGCVYLAFDHVRYYYY